MELRQTFEAAVNETLPLFGLAPVFAGEMEQPGLTSASPVNVLIGLTQGLRGNVLLGFSRTMAVRIVSAMMGGAPVESLDVMAKSALGELGNLLSASAVLKLNSPIPIQISPPTILLGDRLFLMISRVPAKVLQFRFEQDLLAIRVSVE